MIQQEMYLNGRVRLTVLISLVVAVATLLTVVNVLFHVVAALVPLSQMTVQDFALGFISSSTDHCLVYQKFCIYKNGVCVYYEFQINNQETLSRLVCKFFYTIQLKRYSLIFVKKIVNIQKKIKYELCYSHLTFFSLF